MAGMCFVAKPITRNFHSALTTAVRFELTRTMCIGLAIHRLNHSATLSPKQIPTYTDLSLVYKPKLTFHDDVCF